MSRIEEIEERAEKASKGPWKGDRHDGGVKYDIKDADGGIIIHGDNSEYGFVKSWYDSDFVLHSREDIPYLLTLIKEKNAALTQMIGTHGEPCMAQRINEECAAHKDARKALSLGQEDSR